MNLNELVAKIDSYAPFLLSDAFKSQGAHDNSGVIVACHDEVNKVLTCLDLTDDAVKKAIKVGADTIVTHHPAIYYPISSLEVDGKNSAVLNAIKNDINVVSAHLNLDIANEGIDYYLAKGLGAKTQKVINLISGENGYGRECAIDKTTFGEFVSNAVNAFCAVNCFTYGKPEKVIKKFVSFCGAGSSEALSYKGNADVIVTSDMPHHAILELVKKGKCVLLLTHYASEIYGFKKFSSMLSKEVEVHFFDDKIFY